MYLLYLKYIAVAPRRPFQAWNRLSINLEHLGEYGECLNALRLGCEDDCVRGGEWVEIRERLLAKHRKYGKQLSCGSVEEGGGLER